MDDDPPACYEAVVFESKAAYQVLADSPEHDARDRRQLELLEAEPEWCDGEVINTDFGR